MEEQNKQNLENQESEKLPIDITESADATRNDCAKKSTFISKVKGEIDKFIKNTPKKVLIIGASAIGAIIIAAIVLIIVFGGNGISDICQHTYVETVYDEPTCDEYLGYGEKHFTCSKCGDWYRESIPALEHNYVESVYNEPTCGTYGQGDKKYTCNQCGDVYFEYDAIPALECEWTQATCTSAKKCTKCGKTEGYSLGHNYENTTDGTCTRCNYGVTFILPTTPITIMCTSGYDQTCKIESIKIERIQKYSSSTPKYELTFIVQSTYHEKGNNYSDDACFGWKLYDEDGLVVTSGTGYTDGNIKVGEKSKETITFYVGDDEKVQNGKTYRLELLNLS